MVFLVFGMTSFFYCILNIVVIIRKLMITGSSVSEPSLNYFGLLHSSGAVGDPTQSLLTLPAAINKRHFPGSLAIYHWATLRERAPVVTGPWSPSVME